ncbi:hypothetical protein ACFL4M_01865 [Pseudomonadota bacterium]
MSLSNVEMSLSKDEAIVLFEFLSRFSDTETLKIEHQSEERVLWMLTCLLEKELVEPFERNYSEILSQAQERLIAE